MSLTHLTSQALLLTKKIVHRLIEMDLHLNILNQNSLVMKKAVVFAALMVTIVSSCTVLSFYPLYTEEELIKDDRILGTWMAIDHDKDTSIWEIKFKDKKWRKKVNNPFDRGYKEIPNTFKYTLLIHNPANGLSETIFELHLVELDGKTYLDFYPEDYALNNKILMTNLINVHTFARVEIGEELIIQWFDSDWLKNLFDENKIRIKHERNDEYILLTAQPKEIQKFIMKYADQEDAFSEFMGFKLVRI